MAARAPPPCFTVNTVALCTATLTVRSARSTWRTRNTVKRAVSTNTARTIGAKRRSRSRHTNAERRRAFSWLSFIGAQAPRVGLRANALLGVAQADGAPRVHKRGGSIESLM